MTLITRILPPMHGHFDAARIESIYHDRLQELYERNDAMMEIEYKAHCDAAKEPPISRWKTFNAIARIEALRDVKPAQRQHFK